MQSIIIESLEQSSDVLGNTYIFLKAVYGSPFVHLITPFDLMLE